LAKTPVARPVVLPLPSLPQRKFSEYHDHLIRVSAGRVSPLWGKPRTGGTPSADDKNPSIFRPPPSTEDQPRPFFDSPSQTPVVTRPYASSKRPSVYHKPDLGAPAKKRAALPSSNLASSSKPPTSLPVNTRQLRDDRLGTLVSELLTAYDHASSWEDFVTEFRGRSYLSPELEALDHPAADLLRDWRDHGVPSRTTAEPWTAQELDACIERGCHHSATEHADFLREEMAEFIENKFWTVLPYDEVRHLPNLQLSPAAVKDERDRKPRLLCDHSWNPVNDTTLPHAPPEAMQFGGALHRVLRRVRHANPKYGPTFLSKHDIKDGFYRLFLNAKDCPRLAIILPRYEGEPQLVAIPMSCTMGWTESPPTFSSMSETIADVANASFATNTKPQDHRLEAQAAALDDFSPSALERGPDDEQVSARLDKLHPNKGSEPAFTDCPPSNQMYQRPTGDTDVFVDDFIQLGQGSPRRLKALRTHLLHAIDKVLAQPALDEPHRQEAVSLKKLLKGDGSWATRKLILGWIVDTIRQTIELPPHRKETLAHIFEDLAGVKRVSAKKWASILGKLRFVSVAIPGSQGLFSALQWTQNQAKGNRVRVNRFVRESLDAFGRLASSLCQRPTHLAEIVPQAPTLLGATDAAKAGMGGVYFDPSGQGYVWREPFPEEVQRRLVSADNPTGTITNSDLEHAGLLGQVDVMCCNHDVRYATLENFSDNTPAISRVHKGAVSGPGPAANLCRYASDHQRANRYCHLASFLPGEANVMADDASRLQHLTDAAFLQHFQQAYPQPQPWVLLHLPPETSSQLTSRLLSRQSAPPTSPRQTRPATPSSASGPPSATPLASVLTSKTSGTAKQSSPTYLSSACATVGPEPKDSSKTPPLTSLSQLIQWRTPYWRWGRGSPTWVNRIPEKKFTDPATTIPYWLLSSTASSAPTTLPNAPTQPTYQSSAAWPKNWTPNTRLLATPTNTSSTSASSPSTGSCDLPNTPTPPRRKADLRPSASATSPSTWARSSTPPRTRL